MNYKSHQPQPAWLGNHLGGFTALNGGGGENNIPGWKICRDAFGGELKCHSLAQSPSVFGLLRGLPLPSFREIQTKLVNGRGPLIFRAVSLGHCWKLLQHWPEDLLKDKTAHALQGLRGTWKELAKRIWKRQNTKPHWFFCPHYRLLSALAVLHEFL